MFRDEIIAYGNDGGYCFGIVIDLSKTDWSSYWFLGYGWLGVGFVDGGGGRLDGNGGYVDAGVYPL